MQASIPVKTIVSGGQTGVDRAALDVALSLGISCRGWCPNGRTAEDGAIPVIYPLVETPLRDPSQRTGHNVRDSDATLILSGPRVDSPGTALTAKIAQRYGKPILVVDPEVRSASSLVRGWLRDHSVEVLNVAGPRESEKAGVYESSCRFLIRTFLRAGNEEPES